MAESQPISVRVRLVGGLGNQMFSYAAARALAYRNDAELILDTTSGFDRDFTYRREFCLGAFAIHGRRIKGPTGWARLLEAAARRCSKLLPFGWRIHIEEESNTSFDARLRKLHLSHSVSLHGIWQSYRYFEDIAPLIRSDFQVLAPISASRMSEAALIRNTECPVAIGIRRYAEVQTPGAHPVLGEDYYRHALISMSQRVPNPRFFVFTDDVRWAKTSLKLPVPFTLIHAAKGNADAYQKLWLMSQCSHFIISNSTFYWWAAWLAPAPEKTVIAPLGAFPNRDILPPEWVAIPARDPWETSA